MSVDKEQVLAAVRESFEDSATLYSMVEESFPKEEERQSPQVNTIIEKCHASNRERMWDIFAEEVSHHVRTYTVSQYGDFPNDQVAKWDEAQLKTQIEKYLNRLNSSSRGEQESNMDLIKIAHYAQLIWSKRLGFEEAFNEVLKEKENATV